MTESLIDELLTGAFKVGASDVHLKAGSRPALRVEGRLIFVKDAPEFSNEELQKLIYSILNDKQRERFERDKELDLCV